MNMMFQPSELVAVIQGWEKSKKISQKQNDLLHIEVTETGFIKEYERREEANQLRHVINGIATEGNSLGGEIVQERNVYK